MAKLESVKFNKDRDILVSTGDLIDRGPDSIKCLSLVGEPWFHAVYSNHEEMAFNQACGLNSRDDSEFWRKKVGGEWYFDIPDAERSAVNKLIIKQVLKMPVSITVELSNGKTIGCIHGQMPDSDWNNMVARLSLNNYLLIRCIICLRQTFDDLVAFRKGIYSVGPETLITGIDAVVMGHNPLHKPMVADNCMWIDTGKYGDLTLISAEDVLKATSKK